MLDHILKAVQSGDMTIADAKQQLAAFEDLGFAKVDHHRKKRQGFPEVIYGEGKSTDQIIAIAESIQARGDQVLMTRISEEKAKVVQLHFPHFVYAHKANILHSRTPLPEKEQLSEGYVAVIAAGTSDLAVAEEAAVTAEVLGCHVRRIYDVGVAGLHRLLHHSKEIQDAVVSIVVAGMEGALPSVVGGLVAHPVIAVPTSVGYGANFKGLSALLTMLNSCASGISVVNIDNGFGGGYNAAQIYMLAQRRKSDENSIS